MTACCRLESAGVLCKGKSLKTAPLDTAYSKVSWRKGRGVLPNSRFPNKNSVHPKTASTDWAVIVLTIIFYCQQGFHFRPFSFPGLSESMLAPCYLLIFPAFQDPVPWLPCLPWCAIEDASPTGQPELSSPWPCFGIRPFRGRPRPESDSFDPMVCPATVMSTPTTGGPS